MLTQNNLQAGTSLPQVRPVPGASLPKPKARLKAAVTALYPSAHRVGVSVGNYGLLWIRLVVRIDGAELRTCVCGYSIHTCLEHLFRALGERPDILQALS